jgi:hypothetical protein
MVRIIFLILLCIGVALTQSSCFVLSMTDVKTDPVAPAKGYRSLAKFPFKEAWYGIYSRYEKVGYSHFKIEPSGKNFVIINDELIRLAGMRKTNEQELKENVLVRPDLSMVSFKFDKRINDQTAHCTGKPKGDKFVIEAEAAGKKIEREYPLKGKMYHPSGVALIPAIRGLRNAAVYKLTEFSTEALCPAPIEELVISVNGAPGPHDAIWRLKTTIGKTEVFTWLNKSGLPVFSKTTNNGVAFMSVLEDKSTARNFLEKKDHRTK